MGGDEGHKGKEAEVAIYKVPLGPVAATLGHLSLNSTVPNFFGVRLLPAIVDYAHRFFTSRSTFPFNRTAMACWQQGKPIDSSEQVLDVLVAPRYLSHA
ncbi:predicted protein [Plenodomus lingam JN3]|uniref:Predicted protein n=1 Tax=Leptosphaeria maculans (strain JN3 / isolate v23.1.3 / race Av1-4-5-6-7-8) TaxID=985895 RepID=E4ZZ04_LEPMJ|nr:predicted protein [Plenodomus lingam JN3]CBX96439.1 predicted protein [Plenodomus lingam JN3]